MLTTGRVAVDQLYERNSGRVFAYCYARLGSQNLAEWAVGATFDRAQEALANGGLPEQELDWLFRTAHKFCGPRLKLGAIALEGDGALVLRDWQGVSFDQIAAELEAHRAKLDAARRELTPWRRLLGMLNLGPVAGWVQGALSGATVVKAAAAVVAIAGSAVVVGTPVGDRLHDAVVPPAKHSPPSSPAGKKPTRAPVSAQPGAAADPAAGKETPPQTVAAKKQKTGGKAAPTPSPSGAAPTAGQTPAAPAAGAPTTQVPAPTKHPASPSPSVTPPKPPALPDPGAETPAPTLPELPSLPGVDPPSVPPPTPPALPQLPKP